MQSKQGNSCGVLCTGGWLLYLETLGVKGSGADSDKSSPQPGIGTRICGVQDSGAEMRGRCESEASLGHMVSSGTQQKVPF